MSKRKQPKGRVVIDINAEVDATAIRAENIWGSLPTRDDVGQLVRVDGRVQYSRQLIRGATVAHDEWVDPVEVTIRGARKVHGTRTADPLVSMRLRSGLITEKHIKAAGLLAEDYEGGVSCGLGVLKFESTHGSGSHLPSDRQMDALARFRRGMDAVGDERSRRLVCWVVLGEPVATVVNRSVAGWSAVAGVPERVAVGMLVSAMDRLTDLYCPEEKEGAQD